MESIFKYIQIDSGSSLENNVHGDRETDIYPFLMKITVRK